MKITNFFFAFLALSAISLLGGVPTEDTYTEYDPTIELGEINL